MKEILKKVVTMSFWQEIKPKNEKIKKKKQIGTLQPPGWSTRYFALILLRASSVKICKLTVVERKLSAKN